MRLGLVTYNIAKDWDVPTIIQRCSSLEFAGVELRTTHAHGVEENLTSDQRAEVRHRFEDCPIELVGLGTIFEYHAIEPAVLRENIEGTKRYAQLAADVGAGACAHGADRSTLVPRREPHAAYVAALWSVNAPHPQ